MTSSSSWSSSIQILQRNILLQYTAFSVPSIHSLWDSIFLCSSVDPLTRVMLALHFIFITHHLQQQQWLLPHVLCRPQVSVSCARHLIEISAERQIQVWFILPRTQSGTPCLTSVNSLCYLICADRIIPVAGSIHPIFPSHLPNYAVSYNQHKVVFSRSFSFK